ncbi:MAG: ATP-binding protein [Gemmataceae bacterium]
MSNNDGLLLSRSEDPLERVRIAEARFDAVVSGSTDGFLFLDRDGRIVATNPASEFLLGRNGGDLRGEMFGVPIALDSVTEVNVVAQDQTVRTVELRIREVDWQDEVAFILNIRDVTRHKRDTVQAREEVRRRDEFLAMLSHELRNPLAAIEYAFSALRNSQATIELRDRAASVARNQLGHVKRMLDDLLDVTRISQGKIHLQKEPVDLVRLVRDALGVMEPAITKGNYLVKFDHGPRDRALSFGDGTRLQQIVVNLLTNAIKYSPSGSQILVNLSSDRHRVILKVRDEGVGIPADLLSTIFEPFVQGHQHLARSEGGLGVGLALAKMLVDLHGGTIRAHSEGVNKGSEFVVTLPRCRSGAVAQEVTFDEDNKDKSNKSVLVVEDNGDTRLMLKTLLELDGYCVTEAEDGHTALSQLLDLRPSVAIVDIGLPGLNGYEVAKRTREVIGPDEVVLLAVTGYGRADDREKAFASGFDAHLVKPLDYSKLAALLAQHVAR